MLSPHEFTIGLFADAMPLSLILPRTKYETAALIGSINGAPAAVLLSGEYAFHCFETAGNNNWKGVIVPKVRIEVDETSLFDPGHEAQLGAVVRTGTLLIVKATREQSYGNGTAVNLCDGLPPTGEYRAGFTKWQVVLGEESIKRVLWQSPDEAVSPS